MSYYSGIWTWGHLTARTGRPLCEGAGSFWGEIVHIFCSWPQKHYRLFALIMLLGRAELQYKASLWELRSVVEVLTLILKPQSGNDSCRAIRQNDVMEASESTPNTSPFMQKKKKEERCWLFYASLHFSMAGRNMRGVTGISLLVNLPTSLNCPSGCCVWKIRNLTASQTILLCTETRELAIVNTLTIKAVNLQWEKHNQATQQTCSEGAPWWEGWWWWGVLPGAAWVILIQGKWSITFTVHKLINVAWTQERMRSMTANTLLNSPIDKSYSPALMYRRASLRLSKPIFSHCLVLSKYVVAMTVKVSGMMFSSPFPKGSISRWFILSPLMIFSICMWNIPPVKRCVKLKHSYLTLPNRNKCHHEQTIILGQRPPLAETSKSG